MNKLFVVGLGLLSIFEIAAVWFIMPMPYSQRVRSIDIAYALYRWRWGFRAIAVALIFAGLPPVMHARGWRRAVGLAGLVAVTAVSYATNFRMSADHMFLAPRTLIMKTAVQNHVEPDRLVVGVVDGAEARAYPIEFIGYHHQVRDSLAGRPILVSFCTVCRTGRVFNPTVDGHVETFRLVGMDHFNAMFEDASTGSWWRQGNGEAIAGPLTGKTLTEIPSVQMKLAEWLLLHPNSYVMQADPALRSRYSASFDYEAGTSTSALTGRDTASWHDKSWVVGVTRNGQSRAYDWNYFLSERAINDTLGAAPIVLALARDNASFAAFQRPDASSRFTMRGDSLVDNAGVGYDLSGNGVSRGLVPVQASQEFWHSWRTFHPQTTRYEPGDGQRSHIRLK